MARGGGEDIMAVELKLDPQKVALQVGCDSNYSSSNSSSDSSFDFLTHGFARIST